MADEAGFEVAEAYVTLTIDDEAFAEQVTQAIETAVEEGAEGGSATLVAELGDAGAEGGEAFAEGFGGALDELDSTTDGFFEQLISEADEGAEAMQEVAKAAEEASEALAGDGASLGDLQTELKGTVESINVLVDAMEELESSITAGFEEVEAGSVTAAEAIERVQAAMAAANSVTREQAAAMREGMQALAPTVSLDQLKEVAATYAEASAAASEYGVAEAQLSTATRLLANAQANLADQNVLLVESYLTLSAAEAAAMDSANLTGLQAQLDALAEAQATVTSAAQAQVDAMTALNLAAVQGQDVFFDETAAFDGLRAASIQLGVGLGDVAEELMAGNYAMTNAAAAQAGAAIKANLLTEAEQQLAAANLTLIQTYQELDVGIQVSSETQMAALAGVKAAAAQVTSLGGSLSGTAGEADGVAGALGGVEKAAAGAEHGMGGLGEIMMGPWGMAAYGAMTILPMLSSMLDNASSSASTFTSAVSQDSNAVGDNTAATIQTALAKTNLLGISQQMGISQAELIEYAAGESQAQQQVAAAYNAAGQAIAKNASSQAESGYAAKNGVDQTQKQTDALQNEKTILDQVTASVQQAVQQDQANSAALLAAEQSTQIYNASVDALGVSMQTQVEQTQMSNQATVEYGARLEAAEQTTQYMSAAVGAAGVNMLLQQHATEITNLATVQYGDAVMGAYRDTTNFNAAVDASYVSMQEQAQTSAMSSVGLLNLGDSQTALNMQLVASEQSYAQAQQGASAYNTAVTALSGSFNTLYGDEASFTGALASLTTSLKSNGDSLDASSAKGYQNAEAVQAVANAAIQAATATYQNASQTEGSVQAWNTANQYLDQEKDAFEKAAIAAGGNKTAVDQLANSLFKLPPNTQVNVNVNTSSVTAAIGNLATLEGALSDVGGSFGGGGRSAVQIEKSLEHHAAGGIAQAGQFAEFGEEGPEIGISQSGKAGILGPHGPQFGIPGENLAVIPAPQTAQLLGGGGATIHLTQVFQRHPGVEEAWNARREVQSALAGSLGHI